MVKGLETLRHLTLVEETEVLGQLFHDSTLDDDCLISARSGTGYIAYQKLRLVPSLISLVVSVDVEHHVYYL